MSEEFVKSVLEKSGKTDKIYEILGISYDEFVRKVDEFKPELEDILKTGSYAKAGVRLLRWLGLKDEEIDLDNLIKAVMVIRRIIYLHNQLVSTFTGKQTKSQP